jgi:hypothetical protein
MFGIKTDEIIKERILEKSRGGMLAGDAGTRIFAFKVFNKLYFKNPILGKGAIHVTNDTSKDYELVRALKGRSSQIHVGYLSLFYYYGLIGGIIYIIFLVSFTRNSYLIAKKTDYYGTLFAIIQFLLINWTGVVFNVFNMGIVLSMVYQKYYNNVSE